MAKSDGYEIDWFTGEDYEEDRCMGYDCTIQEDFIVRMSLRYKDGVPNPKMPVKMQTRSVEWGEDGERWYEFGLNKRDTLSEAWELFEESVVNQSMCGKPHDSKLKDLDVGRIHYDHGKWVCYTRERRHHGDNLEGRKSKIKSYDELNTLEEALETLSGKIHL